MTTWDIKKMSKDEFMKLDGASEELYNAIQNAKTGFIYITHRNEGHSHKGRTCTFGEGISLRMDTPHEWYHTSVIQKINWEEKWFKTLNSIYDFDFIEYE